MLQAVFMGLALVSGIAVIAAVVMQSSDADGFSAAMGGSDASRFKKGSKEEMLDKLAKYGSVAWIISALIVGIIAYGGGG